MKIKEFFKKTDYRHYLCLLITIGCIACLPLFPYALSRLTESFRDFGLSAAYWLCDFLEIEHTITPTVNDLPNIPNTTLFLPIDWEEFKAKFTAYWVAWANWRNFLSYAVYVLIYATLSVQALSLLVLAVIGLRVWLKRYLQKQNNKYAVDSKAVKVHRRLTFHLYLPVKWWIISFVEFIKENDVWWRIWLVLWAFYFNVFTIIVELCACYFYFTANLDFLSLYRQVYKLLLDLRTPITFLPVWAWIIVGIVIFDQISKNIARDRQYHMEAKNCGFWNARPIVSMACGTMGAGKGTMLTCGGLSNIKMQRDKAFEMLLENDLKFEHFPWIRLEKAMQASIEKHEVYNLATTRVFIQKLAQKFYEEPTRENLFGYDFEHYGFEYDDGLKVVDIWHVLEEYAQLYFIYLMGNFMLANFSVRLDEILFDLGNFPRWNSDFFDRDSRLMDAYSRHCHIIDFNALRLGFKLGEDRTFSDSFEFGVILITEIGKERGNKVENADKRKDSFTTNQKNDGFNSWLKMVRHAATVGGHCFVKVLCDEQRPESWGADARDLCEIIHIREKGERQLSLPFFHVRELLYVWVFNKFASLYYQYVHYRSDYTLPMLLLKSFVAKVEHYYKRTYNTYGYHVLTGDVERGTQDGTVQTFKYYIQYKKVFSKRYSTDCFADYFAVRSLRSAVGFNDMPEYATEKASFEELRKQNSYFVNDLLSGMEDDEEC